jgi:deoxyribodipyrimidine photo-lyase
MTTLVWFRDDLRLTDHAALTAAATDPTGLIALYVRDEVSPEVRPLGGAARWWLHESLSRLRESLAEHGVPLVLRRGRASDVVPQVVAESQADRVVFNRRYGAERHLDERLATELQSSRVEVRFFAGGLLFEPGSVTTGAGNPYRVYTPFWRACLAGPEPAQPLPAPARLLAAEHAKVASDDLAGWSLQPSTPNWATGLAARWSPGEREALTRLRSFLAEPADQYAAKRDVPSAGVGSELSAHLRWGELSVRTVWHESLRSGANVGEFLSEIGWREFAWHTLWANPALHERNLDRRFDQFGWRNRGADADAQYDVSAWQRGETGFALVDAGMRELWQTGFMHNRVRMVTASFLTKQLLVDWRVGEAWFWDTLVDADPASNPFNWQWVAGCGADAAPYFRIFNPDTQLQKFDPDGVYVERWAPDSLLRMPLVDLRATRARALAAYDHMRSVANA